MFQELADRFEHHVGGGLGSPGVSRFGDRADQFQGELDPSAGGLAQPGVRLRAE